MRLLLMMVLLMASVAYPATLNITDEADAVCSKVGCTLVDNATLMLLINKAREERCNI